MIPSSLGKKMKERIHQGHLGIAKCKARARQVMYWPIINADISDIVSNCSICIESRCYHQREPLISHDVPHSHGTKLAWTYSPSKVGATWLL